MDAATTLRQIGTMNLMACGAREYLIDGNTLRMKVLNGRRWVLVTLNAEDTYDVKLIRVKSRPSYEVVTVKEIDGVYCDGIGQAVYDICNKAA